MSNTPSENRKGYFAYLFAFILSPGGIAAPQMTLGFVLFQNNANFLIQIPVDLFQPFGHIFMHGALGNLEAFGGCANGGAILDDPCRQIAGALLDGRSQYHHSPNMRETFICLG